MKSIIVNNTLTFASLDDVEIKNGKKVYIVPKSVKEIECNAFLSFCIKKQQNLDYFVDEIILNDNIKKIEPFTFNNLNAKTVILSNNLQNIGNGAFSQSKIEKIIILDSVINIDEYAFKGCKNLKFVSLSNNIKILNQSTFNNCINLKEIILPSNLKKIGHECFRGSGLENIVIPNNVHIIDSFAFCDCINLKNIKLPENKRFERLGVSIFQDCEKLNNVIIPNSVKSIGGQCFSNCKSLTNIKFPNKLEYLCLASFYNCLSLKEITIINKNLKPTCIDEQVFSNCKSLEKVTMLGYFDFYSDLFRDCKSLKQVNIYGLEIDLSPFKNLDFYIDNKEALERLNIISKAVKGYTTLEYNFAYELAYFNQQEIFKNAFFKFYNRLKNKFISQNDDSKDITKFETLCYNLGVFNQNREIANKAYNFLDEMFSKNVLELKTLGSYFLNFHPKGYKKEFVDFITNKENFIKIMDLENQDLHLIVEIYDKFEDLQENHLSKNNHHRNLAPTVEFFKEKLALNKFKGINEKNILIAEEVAKFSNKQSHFETALNVMKELKKMQSRKGFKDKAIKENPFENIEIIENEIKKTNLDSLATIGKFIDNNFSYEWLAKNDPRNLMLGYYCSCCAHIGGAGDGIMRASIILPNVRNLVIKNNKGRIVAKATLYINIKQGYGVFNTIQVNENIIDEKEKEKIFQKFLKGAYDFIEDYNKNNRDKPLTKVNVGLGLNSLSKLIFRDFKESEILQAIDFSNYKIDQHYNGDWQDMQFCIYNKNEPFKKEIGEENLYNE